MDKLGVPGIAYKLFCLVTNQIFCIESEEIWFLRLVLIKWIIERIILAGLRELDGIFDFILRWTEKIDLLEQQILNWSIEFGFHQWFLKHERKADYFDN